MVDKIFLDDLFHVDPIFYLIIFSLLFVYILLCPVAQGYIQVFYK